METLITFQFAEGVKPLGPRKIAAVPRVGDRVQLDGQPPRKVVDVLWSNRGAPVVVTLEGSPWPQPL